MGNLGHQSTDRPRSTSHSRVNSGDWPQTGLETCTWPPGRRACGVSTRRESSTCSPGSNDDPLTSRCYLAAMDESPLDAPIEPIAPVLAGSNLVDRLDDAESRLQALAEADNAEGLTQPDPGSSERWEQGQVWAHIAEFVPYWHGEMQSVIGSYDGTPVPFGRTKTDPARIAAIEMGRHEQISDQMTRTDESIAALKSYLAGLTPAEWNAVGLHPTRGEMDVEQMVERFVVAHLEEHAEQLDKLR